MSREWKEVKFSEIMDIIGGGTPKTNVEEYWNGDIPWLSVKDFNHVNRKVYDTEKKITILGLEKSSTKLLNKGDIIISARGTVGALAQLGKPMAFNQSCYGLRANNRTNNDYLFYSLKYKIDSIQQNTHGSVFDTITKNTFDVLSAIIPSNLKEQKAIAHILSTLDEKIEVNNQINKKLEEMAQTIFKHWFVDFEFPNENGEPYKSSGGEMVESELGMIPKGWKVDSIGDLVKEIVTGKTPSTKDPENYGNKYPFITIPDMHNNVFITKTERYLSEKGNKVQINKLLPENSIIVSCIATVGLVAINEKPAHTNQQINSIIPNRDEDVYYFYEYLKLMSDKFKAIGSTGSTTLNVNKGEFEKIKYIYPQKQVMIAFNNLIKSNFEMIKKKQLENESLSNLRDTLLPKLMSGELRVPLEETDIS